MSAASRLTHADVPYKRTDGKMVAANWADLTDGTILAPINLNEAGKRPGTGRLPWPWTNTNPDGTIVDIRGTRVCGDWKDNPPYRVRIGDPDSIDAKWTFGETVHCTATGHLYCFQQ